MRSWLIALIVALAAVAWIGSGFLVDDDRADASSTAMDVQASATGQAGRTVAGDAAPARSVRVVTSEEEPVSNVLTLQGQTVADRVVDVRAKVDGEILDLLVARGETVETGRPIARLEVQDREARVAEAEALVAQREVEFNATQRLHSQGHRSTTELAAARAALDAANAVLQMARLNLDRTEVRAPFAGVVEQLIAEAGEYVREGDGIVRLVHLDPIKVEVQVSERYLGQIGIGTDASARLMGGRTLDGAVSYVGRTASSATRTFPVEIRFDNPDGSVIAGITATVRLPLEDMRGHLLPASILVLDDDGALGIMTVDAADRVVFQPVEILSEAPGGGLWLGGLPPEIRVIVVGQGFVTAASTVRPVEISGADLRRLIQDGSF